MLRSRSMLPARCPPSHPIRLASEEDSVRPESRKLARILTLVPFEFVAETT